MNTPIAPVSFDAAGAAQASGLSVQVIRRAMRAGDLPVHYPEVDGRQIDKPLIDAEDLRAWVRRGKNERSAA
jgi:hypothetical protein